MKRIKLRIEESVTYESEGVIEVPDDLTESQLNTILDDTQKKVYDCQAGDVFYHLNRDHGFKTVSQSSGFPDSPSDSQLEITEYEEVEDGKY